MAEAIGLALGVVPLVISAMQSFKSVSRSFQAVQNFPWELRSAISRLRSQEIQFRKANERVLGSCVDPKIAQAMVQDANNPSWKDPHIGDAYAELLGQDEEAFRDTVSLTCSRLECIRKELRHFSFRPNESAKALRKRLRYAFEHSKMEASIADLRSHVLDFIALTKAILGTRQPTQPRSSDAVVAMHLRAELQRFAVVRQTAEDLHVALGSACFEHNLHHAVLSLEPASSDDKHVQFNLLYSHTNLPISPVASNADFPCLTVESSISGYLTPVSAPSAELSKLATRLKRQKEDEDAGCTEIPKSKSKKQVNFANAALLSPSATPPAAKANVPGGQMPDLCRQRMFCSQLARLMALPVPSPVRSPQAVGYLERQAGSKHLLYIDSVTTTLQNTTSPARYRSLRSLLLQPTTATGDNSLELPQRSALAKQLARAILRYYATGWLVDTWDSQAIIIRSHSPRKFSSGSSTNKMEVYTATSVVAPGSPSSLQPQAIESVAINNRLLFSLGAVLLELAYQQPFHRLITNMDRLNSSPTDIPFRTARRLAERVSAKMGAEYAEAVRRCVHCDFGQGFDLGTPRLQEAFYRDVVCILDRYAETTK